jgi:hypothetical protein
MDKPKTRQDIAKILADIAPPGEKRAEKIEAIKALGLSNSQGYGIEVTLESYGEY